MDGPRGYDVKQNKSDRERQIPYGFTYMWNLKNKTNEQNRNRLTQRTSWLPDRRGFGELGKKGKEI